MTYLTSKQIEILNGVLESLAVMDVPADFIAYLNKYIARSDMHLIWSESDAAYTTTFYDYTFEIIKAPEDQFIPKIKVDEDTVFEGAQVLSLEAAERMIALHMETIQ